MQAHYGKDIWLVGGGTLVQEFLQHKLSEIGVAIHPRLLGKVIPLFTSPYAEMELELLNSKQCSTGLLQAFYRVK